MCEKCFPLRQEIETCHRIVREGTDALTTRRLREYVQELETRLAALEAAPGLGANNHATPGTRT